MKTSEKMDSVLASLIAAKAKIGVIVKDKSNPFHKSKYADINSFLEVVEPVLLANGLVLLQPTGRDEFGPFVETKIIDVKTGQFVSCRVDLIVVKQDMQSLGSAITYARRYSLQSLLALQADDDDGNVASNVSHKPQAVKPQPKPVEGEVVHVGDELVGFGKNKDRRFKDVELKNLLALETFIHNQKIDDPRAQRFLSLLEAYRHEQELNDGFKGAIG